MTKDVLIKISGLQVDSEDEGCDNEPVEIITAASYYEKDGKHYIFYEEMEEGTECITKNRITLNPDRIEIHKSGHVNTSMIFEKNSRTNSAYDTPFGRMMMGISSGDISLNVTDSLISTDLSYTLDINSQALLNCELNMQIVPKKNGRSLMTSQ